MITPARIISALLSISSRIDRSVNPSRKLVANDLKRIITAIEFGPDGELLPPVAPPKSAPTPKVVDKTKGLIGGLEISDFLNSGVARKVESNRCEYCMKQYEPAREICDNFDDHNEEYNGEFDKKEKQFKCKRVFGKDDIIPYNKKNTWMSTPSITYEFIPGGAKLDGLIEYLKKEGKKFSRNHILIAEQLYAKDNSSDKKLNFNEIKTKLVKSGLELGAPKETPREEFSQSDIKYSDETYDRLKFFIKNGFVVENVDTARCSYCGRQYGPYTDKDFCVECHFRYYEGSDRNKEFVRTINDKFKDAESRGVRPSIEVDDEGRPTFRLIKTYKYVVYMKPLSAYLKEHGGYTPVDVNALCIAYGVKPSQKNVVVEKLQNAGVNPLKSVSGMSDPDYADVAALARHLKADGKHSSTHEQFQTLYDQLTRNNRGIKTDKTKIKKDLQNLGIYVGSPPGSGILPDDSFFHKVHDYLVDSLSYHFNNENIKDDIDEIKNFMKQQKLENVPDFVKVSQMFFAEKTNTSIPTKGKKTAPGMEPIKLSPKDLLKLGRNEMIEYLMEKARGPVSFFEELMTKPEDEEYIVELDGERRLIPVSGIKDAVKKAIGESKFNSIFGVD